MKCFPLNSHIKKKKIITTLNIQKAIVSFKFFRHFILRFQREKLRKTQGNGTWFFSVLMYVKFKCKVSMIIVWKLNLLSLTRHSKNYLILINNDVHAKMSLTLWAPIPKNGQTHSNSTSANCRRIVWKCLTILWYRRLKG